MRAWWLPEAVTVASGAVTGRAVDPPPRSSAMKGARGSVELLLVLVFHASGIGVVGGCQVPVQ